MKPKEDDLRSLNSSYGLLAVFTSLTEVSIVRLRLNHQIGVEFKYLTWFMKHVNMGRLGNWAPSPKYIYMLILGLLARWWNVHQPTGWRGFESRLAHKVCDHEPSKARWLNGMCWPHGRWASNPTPKNPNTPGKFLSSALRISRMH